MVLEQQPTLLVVQEDYLEINLLPQQQQLEEDCSVVVSKQQQQQQQQQQQIQTPQLTGMTRVGDLPPNIKNELEQFDKYINTQHVIATTLNSDMSKHNNLINTIPKDINYLQNKVLSTKQALKFDINQLINLKNMNNEITEDINKIMQLILQLSTQDQII